MGTLSTCRACARSARTARRTPPSHWARSTSATRAGASSRPGSCGSRAPGATAARRWPRRRTCRSTIRRPQWSRRTRSPTRTSRSPRSCPTGRSCSAAAAPRTSAPLEGLSARHDQDRARLARRARRPQHAGDVAVRERLGDAAADGRRLRDGRSRKNVALIGARNLDPPEEDVHRRERDPHRPGRASTGHSRTAAASTSPSTSTRSIRRRSRPSCPSRTV